MIDPSQLPFYIAWFLLFISAISGIALLVKAWIDNVPEATANILWPVFVGAAGFGLFLNKSLLHVEHIFLAILGAISGLSLVIRAIFNSAHKPGSSTLLALFLISLGTTLLLYFSPHLFSFPEPPKP